MKFALPLLALAGTAFAHNFVTHFHINGVADPDCVRQAASANPILDINSSDMACNAVQGLAKKKCVVQAGDVVGYEWRTDRNIAPADYPLKDGSIPVGVTDDSHKGPCSVYMKKVSDSSTAEGEGDGWFKVSEDGLDSAGTFCSDRIRLANAPQAGIIPTNIEPGDYLIRAEMITLNNAGPASMGGLEQPQFYVGCIQATVEGSSGTNPDTVSIPGYVSMSSPGMIYDIWNSPSGTFSDYTVPGPAPLEDLVPFKAGVAPSTIGGSSGSTPSTKASSTRASTAAPYTSQVAATSVRAPATTTKAYAVTSTPASNGDAEDVPSKTSAEDVPAETSAEDVPAETSAEDVPSETSAEDVPAKTSAPAGEAPTQAPVVVATTVTYTTLVTSYTTVSVTAGETMSTVVVDDSTPASEVAAEPTHAYGGHGHRRGGRAHRKRHYL
ncbi:uncharacterized protein H6S33_010578 [Morchella sextelata]|uniref:uncharacterized protein n=1 Tax=Morchella sextelata TaxID=1174677 RepID=UPI001D036EF6|nr:uncharacterized protein H6S33_010578 [Morchella sextelata]KAH0611313.1 hypothetical protein H6S33_010578 [Morchella sextelata]